MEKERQKESSQAKKPEDNSSLIRGKKMPTTSLPVSYLGFMFRKNETNKSVWVGENLEKGGVGVQEKIKNVFFF
jgi:hypothetical protein